MKTLVRPLLVIFITLTVITGLAYPYLVTGAAQLTMRRQANGSLLAGNGGPRGSALIGQTFSSPRYFWGRPSATTPMPYNASASSGSNLGPTNPAQLDAVKTRIAALRASDPGNATPLPIDLVSASGSGLDPEISPAAAQWQAPRVARTRHLDLAQVQALIVRYTASRQLGILGEPRVNVLRLNLALDALSAQPGATPAPTPAAAPTQARG